MQLRSRLRLLIYIYFVLEAYLVVKSQRLFLSYTRTSYEASTDSTARAVVAENVLRFKTVPEVEPTVEQTNCQGSPGLMFHTDRILPYEMYVVMKRRHKFEGRTSVETIMPIVTIWFDTANLERHAGDETASAASP